MRRIGAPCTAVRVSLCVCVYVRVCACVCLCVRACLTDENRALRDISTHKPPATSKRQKPKSAPDDALFRLRWPVPGTSGNFDAQS